jgi:hypothetical protein
MILSDFFDHVNAAYRGSDDDAPAEGTADYTTWLLTTNRKISEWARDGKHTWNSLFEIRDVDTVVAGTQTYTLDSDILQPSDKVIVTTTDDEEIEYKLSEPQERLNGTCYIVGRNLTFVDDIEAGDEIVGGTISLGAYYLPADLADGADTIPVDDAYWLVNTVAATLAFNDLTYESKAPALNAAANSLYSQMISNNRRGSYGSPRKVPTSVNRIREHS